MIEFNIGSDNHISALFFGGKFLEDVKIENGVFKGGKTPGAKKYKNVKQCVEIRGLGLNPIGEKNKKGVYGVDESILKIIAKKSVTDAGHLASLLLEIRGLKKMIATYFESTEENIIEGYIHGQYNHTLTDTGRLSHSKPNMGNQPKPPELPTKHFISRFINGKLVVVDYKSIEPRVEAELCQDQNLMRDVENGLDVHTKNLALAQKLNYEEVVELVASEQEWSAKRSKIKGFTFAQQYLASIKTTARNSGLTEQECQDILDARKEEYKSLYKWHEKNNEEVKQTGQYKSMLGQVWKFKKYDPKYSWQTEGNYSPNQISNYKTQGTAWTIVSTMLGRFWREKALYNRNKYLMVNTVHDNLILDCKQEYTEQAKKDLELLTNWKEICYNRFQYSWKVKIEIDIKEGGNWYECF